MRHRIAPYHVFLVQAFGRSGLVALGWTVAQIYYVRTIQLSPLEIVLVGTVMELVYFVLEVPTGVAADAVSRRLSVITGVALFGAGFAVQGLVPRLGAVMAGSVLFGLAWTFVSGATEAWVADEVDDRDIGQVFLRGAQASSVGALVGTIASVAIASVALNLPLVVAGAGLGVLAVFLVFTMPERGRPRDGSQKRPTLLAVAREGAGAVRRSRVLVLVLLIAVAWGLSSEGFDRLWDVHVVTNFELPAIGGLDPVVWFGIMRGASLVLNVGATEVVRRRVDTVSPVAVVRTLIVIDVLQVVALVVLGLTVSFGVAVCAYLAVAVVRQVQTPLWTGWLTRMTEPRVRATVLSMAGMADSLGEITGGPIVGTVGTLRSLRAAMVATALPLLPAVGLLVAAGRRSEVVVETASGS